MLHRDIIHFCRVHRKYTCKIYRENGIKPGHPKILLALQEQNGCIQNEISQLCGIEPASTTAVLNVMERDGLIRRQADETNKRVKLVFLTDRGREQIKRLNDLDKKISAHLLGLFSPDQQQELLAMFDVLTKAMSREISEERGDRP